MLTFDATEQINEVSRTTRTRTTTQVITRMLRPLAEDKNRVNNLAHRALSHW